MFMRYRGGGIGHACMRDVENQFEDMRRDQDSLEALQAATAAQIMGNNTGEPLASTSTATTPTRGALLGDGENDWDESSDDERVAASFEDDYLEGDEDGDNDYGEGILQGTYGLGEY